MKLINDPETTKNDLISHASFLQQQLRYYWRRWIIPFVHYQYEINMPASLLSLSGRKGGGGGGGGEVCVYI